MTFNHGYERRSGKVGSGPVRKALQRTAEKGSENHIYTTYTDIDVKGRGVGKWRLNQSSVAVVTDPNRTVGS